AESVDYFVTAAATIPLAAPRIATPHTHGTGCSLSSAIAAGLAKGEDMDTAVRGAKAWISAAIAAADRFAVGHGHGPVHHFH
ncbi:bifunctional hydroxymethylpyrimidine kinase/phosphomethylpyrimidine kinase, partial [Acinetobacter baumannii]